MVTATRTRRTGTSFLLWLVILLLIGGCSAPAAEVLGTPTPRPTAATTGPNQGGASLGDAHAVTYPPGIRSIKERGTLVVAVADLERYPFFYLDQDGALVGADIDLARAIGQALGVAVEFNRSVATFDGVVDLVARGEADVAISKLSVTLDRALRVRFSNPTSPSHRRSLSTA